MRSPGGNAISGAAGAQTWVFEEGTTDEVPVYDVAVGGAALPQPISPSSDGQLDAYWVDVPQQLTIHTEYSTFEDDLSFPALLATDLGGREIEAVEFTAQFPATSVYPTWTDVTGVEIPVVHGVRPILLTVGCNQLQHNTANGFGFLGIREGGNTLASGSGLTNAVSNRGSGAFARKRVIPDPGVAHTYKVSLAAAIAGTLNLSADVTLPLLFLAQEL